MRNKSCAIMIDEKGQVAIELFDKYVSAEACVRNAKKARLCVEGYACESRYAFVIKAEKKPVKAEPKKK